MIRDIWLLRMGALLAQALGDETAYHDYWDGDALGRVFLRGAEPSLATSERS